MKKSNYLRPKLSTYERNFTIIQQLPNMVRKNLASIDCNKTEAIGQVLANLDAIYNEKNRNFERKQFDLQRNSNESVQVQKVEIQNKYQGNNNKRRGNFHNKSVVILITEPVKTFMRIPIRIMLHRITDIEQ